MHVLPFGTSLALPALVQRLARLPGVCWLDGDAVHAEGRYSFLAAEPVEHVRAPLAAADPFAPLALIATPAEQHRSAIACALEHIARGDFYQVNLARCWQAEFDGDPLVLWHALRMASAVPFGFYFDDGARVVMARTMERFLRWQRA